MASKQFFNGASTSVSSTITSGATSITGLSTATWPSAGDYIIRIDGFAPGTSTPIFEDILVTANNQGTGVLTVTRGQDSTSGQAFAANATLTPVISASMINNVFARIDGTGIPLPYATGATVPTSLFGTVAVKIDDILVGTDSRYPGATAQITFLNTSNSGTNLLPTGFRHLAIDWYARGDTAATSTTVLMRFNNISTNTYDFQYTQGNGAAASAAETLTTSSIQIGTMAAASATANYFSQGETKVKYYQGTVGNKLALSNVAHKSADTTGTLNSIQFIGGWRTVGTAITRLDILPGAGNFVVGSVFTLYGLP